MLSVIPEDRSALRHVAAGDTPFRRLDTEAFRMLRSNLRYFNVDEELNSILVMSARPEEGKTSIAWNLPAPRRGRQARAVHRGRPAPADAGDPPGRHAGRVSHSSSPE